MASPAAIVHGRILAWRPLVQNGSRIKETLRAGKATISISITPGVIGDVASGMTVLEQRLVAAVNAAQSPGTKIVVAVEPAESLGFHAAAEIRGPDRRGDPGPLGEVTDWLLEGPAWVQYRVRLDLLRQPEDDKAVMAARRAMLADPQVKELVAELASWPGPVLTSHKSAGHLIHKLVFLADLGLRARDPGVMPIVTRVMAHQADAGPFQVLMNIPKHFGGTGRDERAWALCDAPLLLYALGRFGRSADRRVSKGVKFLAALVRDNGWPCAVSPELGRFRGPGRKDDPCPYATLIMLQLLVEFPELHDGPATRAGTEVLLTLWAESRKRHPYMFFAGTDFRKLKAPFVWYDIAHVLDVLTRFPWLRGDPRLGEMAGVVAARADRQGRFTAESVWKAWAGWEFGQKREPSRWLTFLALRALQRVNGGA